MRRAKAFSTVNWRKYLDVKTNPRAKSFLESRGDDVLWQIAQNIYRDKTRRKENQVILLVHPNAGAVIRIKEDEYEEVLNLCLNWFLAKENYKRCSKIKWFLDNFDKIKKGLKPELEYKEIVV